MSELDETIREFLVESFENLEQLDRELLVLESNPHDLDTINKIFRIVHTIKGTCGFFDFHKLERVSHVGENLLDSLRAERVAVSEMTITALLALCDSLREILTEIEKTGVEGTTDYSNLIEVLTSLNQTATATPHVKDEKHNQSVKEDSSIILLSQEVSDSKSESEENVEPNVLPTIRDYLDSTNVNACVTKKIESEVESPASSSEPPVQKAAPASGTELISTTAETRKSEVADTSLRVDVGILDKLMNLVGELVLARNQILQFTKKQNDGDFVNTSQRLNLITSELQDGVMRTRMQPISTVWNKLPRVVRDMSHTCGKQVVLEMQGKETELDKTIIEAIKDPLTHIIRNSVDHGIETPERRISAGKTPEGTLLMRAFHEGGQVIIEISDDGSGLNIDRIRSKALEKGLISPDRAAQMSESEIHRLIFLPGFSTAEKITNISGRGVGMDVVRSNIERIGGVVDVASQFGKGSKFTIKIPLTLAIIPGLIVTTGGNRYAIPQVNLLELVRIEGEQIKKTIERIQGADFYRLRGKLLPLVYLDEQLSLTSNVQARKSSIISLVVVRADSHQFGLVVDAIHDTEEIVVKPLGRILKGISAFAGATIMGDGQVALILDVVGLARRAQIAKKESVVRAQQGSLESSKAENKKQMFVFEIGKNRRAAVPLENVYRLEEFSHDKLEYAGDRIVVQYRDGILPLVDLNSFFDPNTGNSEGLVRAFVYSTGEQFVGFIVNRIVDIVEQAVKIESPYRKVGLIGSSVIQGKVTDLLDLPAILEAQELRIEQVSEEQRGAA